MKQFAVSNLSKTQLAQLDAERMTCRSFHLLFSTYFDRPQAVSILSLYVVHALIALFCCQEFWVYFAEHNRLIYKQGEPSPKIRHHVVTSRGYQL